MYTFNFVGDINEETTNMLSEYVTGVIEDIDSSQGENCDALLLNISSRGGEIEAMFACVDILENSGLFIITNVNGYCYSSALPLYLVGEIRTAGKNALFMYHKCSYGIDGTILNHEEQLELSHKMQNKFDRLITSKTNIEQSLLDTHTHRDWYFDVEEAEKVGVVNAGNQY